jgi:hypothetical protein
VQGKPRCQSHQAGVAATTAYYGLALAAAQTGDMGAWQQQLQDSCVAVPGAGEQLALLQSELLRLLCSNPHSAYPAAFKPGAKVGACLLGRLPALVRRPAARMLSAQQPTTD